MLDIKLIRDNPKIVEENLKKRGDEDKIKLLKDLLKFDEEYRKNLQKLEELNHKRNEFSKKLSELAEQKDKGLGEFLRISSMAKMVVSDIKMTYTTTESLKKEVDNILMKLPNLLHESVPVGKDESEDVIIKTWGKPPKFDFKPKNHLEILKGLGLIDDERAEKVTGRGFFYLKGPLALLDRALQSYAIESLIKKGYQLFYPPHMLRREPYSGMVDLADFESVMYKIENEDLYLIATAEHPIGAMFKDETLNKKNLPLKIVGFSTNFRKEVGSHGKYTKGLFRMHQFNKIEQFIFCLPQDSWKFHEELQKNSEELYQGLGLHYQVANVCTGDIGSIAAKKYDILCWMADGAFRETGSNSNCTDYQARRLSLKYREKEGQAPVGFVHTLNNTALATSRTMVALIEQFQQKDGTVLIPKVLWPYMNGIKKLEKIK